MANGLFLKQILKRAKKERETLTNQGSWSSHCYISVLYFEKKFYKWNRYFLSLFETQIDKGLIFDNDSRWSGHKPVLYILNFFTRKKLGCSFSHFFVLLPFWKYISNLICFWCWQQQNGVWQGKFFVACLSVHILSSLSTLQEIWSLWWETTNYTK